MTEAELRQILGSVTKARRVVELSKQPSTALTLTCKKVFSTAQLRPADLINQKQHKAVH